jgi:hypothetical protein
VVKETSVVQNSNSFSCSGTEYSSSTVRTIFIIIIWFCEAIGTAATPGLLCQPQVIVKMTVEKQMECRLAGETEVLGENLPQRHFSPTLQTMWAAVIKQGSHSKWSYIGITEISIMALILSFTFFAFIIM